MSSKQEKPSFAERVRKIVRAIPEGSVMSYGEIARRAGMPGAARAVGTLMKGNFDDGIPCHRVVRSDGKLGEYNRGGTSAKAKRLKAEGVRIAKDRVIQDFK